MKIKKILERFILLIILISIAQTFMMDYAVYKMWGTNPRHILIFIGLGIDIIFTVEFFTRSIAAARNKKLLFYWFHNRGWVDFLSSIPLLLLNSIPAVIIILFTHENEMLAGMEIVNFLKIVKAIRVTRILRLVRVLKIFGKIKNTESSMAQHHTAVISTMTVFTMILIIILFGVFHNSETKSIEIKTAHYKNLFETMSKIYPDEEQRTEYLTKILTHDDQIERVKYKDKDVAPFDFKKFHSEFAIEDFIHFTDQKFELWISIKDENSNHAMTYLQFLAIIIMLVTAYSFLYARHFAMTISDILYIFNKGFRKRDYNLQVHIPNEYQEHEIFKFAKYYNDSFLPAKMKKIDSMNSDAGMSIDMLKNFNKK